MLYKHIIMTKTNHINHLYKNLKRELLYIHTHMYTFVVTDDLIDTTVIIRQITILTGTDL